MLAVVWVVVVVSHAEQHVAELSWFVIILTQNGSVFSSRRIGALLAGKSAGLGSR